MNDVILSADELFCLTGYRLASKQLAELRRQGFWRARRSPLGGVILERAHYEAVVTGRTVEQKPQVRLAVRPAVRVA